MTTVCAFPRLAPDTTSTAERSRTSCREIRTSWRSWRATSSPTRLSHVTNPPHAMRRSRVNIANAWHLFATHPCHTHLPDCLGLLEAASRVVLTAGNHIAVRLLQDVRLWAGRDRLERRNSRFLGKQPSDPGCPAGSKWPCYQAPAPPRLAFMSPVESPNLRMAA